jgi:hypothetical protein
MYKYGRLWPYSTNDIPDAHWAYQLISPSAEVFTKEELRLDAQKPPTDEDEYNPCKI